MVGRLDRFFRLFECEKRKLYSWMNRLAFTLVELVVVVLILGILAGVAAPKYFDITGKARDDGLRKTLKTVRDAIELYSAYNGGALPGGNGSQAALKNGISPYLRDEFPAAPLGPAAGQRGVDMVGGNAPLEGVDATVRPWKYNYNTGEFIFNYSGVSVDGTTPYDEF